MQLIGLTQGQVDIAACRFREHGNSPARIARHYRKAHDNGRLRTCRAIRRVEREFAINLGTVCFKFLEKETRPTPSVQRKVMDYVAAWLDLEGGERQLVISVDRVREVDRLAEGDPEWASSRGF